MRRAALPADLSKLSAAKLHALIDRFQAEHSADNQACIDAGLGTFRYSDTKKLVEEEPDSERGRVGARWLESGEKLSAAQSELKARQEWHGSDRPIKIK